ncbi:MAG: hypothetical protein HC889_06405 [Synechococcaceae cyanobacterium SM1_2_3]|nr:hypothetical protein [Synechococcaceae cyanobacterium SM1_2_3]
MNPSTVDDTRIDEFTYMVLFGTGRYLGNADITSASPQTQSAYGIWDNLKSDTCPTTACFDRADLQQQIFCPGNPVDSTCQ